MELRRVQPVDYARLMMAALDSHMALVGHDGTILATNRAWDLFGEVNGGQAPRGWDVGVNYFDVLRRSSSSGDRDARLVLDGLLAVRDGRESRFGYLYPCHSPVEERWFELRVTQADAPDQACILVNHVNCTELVEARTQVERLNGMLRTSNRELEEFAFRASHDLLAPIRRMGGLAALLREEGEGIPDTETLIGEIQRNAADMRQLVEELLELSRVGGGSTSLVPVCLDEACSRALDHLEEHIDEVAASVSVGELPVVLGHRSEVERLLRNLIDNGLRYARPGVRPFVGVSAEARGGTVRLRVRDNGVGMTAEQLRRAYEPFQRGPGAARHPGTGLGLTMCKRIVERSGGQIDATSTVGVGTTFTVTLPAA